MAPTPPTPSKHIKGRHRIEMRLRENVEERRVTFTKRRTGLFEKAAELCLLCGAKIAILTFSEGRKAFCFGNPDIDYILECYLTGRSPSEICLPGGCGGGEYDHTLGESKQLYEDALRGLEREKGEGKSAAAAHTVAAQDGGFWWDRSAVDDLSLQELEFYHDALEKMMKSVQAKIDNSNEHSNNHGADMDTMATDNLIISGLEKNGFAMS